jgi:hypothetical protein
MVIIIVWKQSNKDLSAGCKLIGLRICRPGNVRYFSIENPLQIRSVRRTVARLATELTKELQYCNLLKDGKKRNLRKERVSVVT